MRKPILNYTFLFFIALFIITALFAFSLYWNIYNEEKMVERFAQIEASAAINKDIVFRRWASTHGGVYVPITPANPPNPYLSFLPNRDIIIDSNKKYTLINPAYMIRQVHELANKEFGLKSHITSLTPLNPINKADSCEVIGLLNLKKGNKQFTFQRTIDSVDYIGVMHPFIVDATCLKCHRNEGYTVGDLKGGISILVPMNKYYDVKNKQVRIYIQTYLIILVSIYIIGTFGYFWYRRKSVANKKYQAEIEKNKEQLLKTHQIARISSWTFQTELGIFNFSDNCFKILEINPENSEFELSRLLGFIHPEDQEKIREYFQHLSSDQPVFRFQTPLGNQKYITVKSERINNQMVEGFFQEITELKNTEEALIKSEKNMRLLFENMNSGFVLHKLITDIDGNPVDFIYIDANKKSEEITGFAVSDIINKSVYEITPSIDPDWIKKFGNVALTGVPFEFVNYIEHYDKYLDTKVYSPQIGYFALIFFDVSEKVKTQFALQQSEERYKLAVGASHLGIWDWVTDSQEVYFSDLWKQQIGYEPYELKNELRTWEHLIHHEDISKTKTYLASYLQNPSGQFLVEYRFKHKLGYYIWIQSRAEAIVDVQGKVSRMFGTHRDITIQKDAQAELERHQKNLESIVIERTNELLSTNEELNAANEELLAINELLEKQKNELQVTLQKLQNTQNQLIQSEKMASLGVLMAGIAHEINNPINFINSGIYGLKDNIQLIISFIRHYQIDNPESFKHTNLLQGIEINDLVDMVESLTQGIEMGVKRTTGIIKSLKIFARPNETVLERFDVVENIENTLVILFHQYKNRVTIKKDFSELPKIECFPGQINQVFMNILINAIEAIEDKGEIEICTKTFENFVEIKISDTGKGIAEDQISKIFDPFFTTKPIGKGTGLGLSITYNIISNHKGTINVKSAVNKGTTFTIQLPVNL